MRLSRLRRSKQDCFRCPRGHQEDHLLHCRVRPRPRPRPRPLLTPHNRPSPSQFMCIALACASPVAPTCVSGKCQSSGEQYVPPPADCSALEKPANSACYCVDGMTATTSDGSVSVSSGAYWECPLSCPGVAPGTTCYCQTLAPLSTLSKSALVAWVCADTGAPSPFPALPHVLRRSPSPRERPAPAPQPP